MPSSRSTPASRSTSVIPVALGQRGTNENTNGLLRDYLPKGTDFKPITQARLDAVAAELTGRPRQTLGWVPPSAKFAEAVALTPRDHTSSWP